MPDAHVLIPFALASLALNLTPGPDMLYAITRGATHGPAGALAAAFGNLLGSIIHTAFVVVGISALLVASSTAFTIIKFLGAGYLIYIGLRALLTRAHGPDIAQRARVSLARVVRESFLIHTLNPKVAIFFLAFLPQFVSKDSPAPARDLAFLGLWFTVQASLVLAVIAAAASLIRDRVPIVQRAGLILKRVSGGVLVAFGLRLAASGAR